MVGLADLADQKIATLSGGQRRRLDVAIGIVGRPELLFLDEPTAGFDPHARRDFHHLVHRLSDLEGTTILLTTHDLDEAEKLADRILILADGTIVAAGSADQLARQVARDAEVRWSRDGETFVHSTADATAFVRELLNQHGDEVSDLEVRRASLEDIYIDLVHTQRAARRGGDPVSATRNAIGLGLRRGWTEFVQSLRSPQDQGFYLFTALTVLGYLLIRRNDTRRGHRPARPVGRAAEHPRRPGRLRRRHRAGVRARDGARGRDAAAPQGRARTACAATSPASSPSTASASCRSCW